MNRMWPICHQTSMFAGSAKLSSSRPPVWLDAQAQQHLTSAAQIAQTRQLTGLPAATAGDDRKPADARPLRAGSPITCLFARIDVEGSRPSSPTSLTAVGRSSN